MVEGKIKAGVVRKSPYNGFSNKGRMGFLAAVKDSFMQRRGEYRVLDTDLY